MKNIIDLVVPPKYLDGIPHFLSGSQRYGQPTPASDIDICVPILARHDLFDTAPGTPRDSSYNNGFTFGYNKKTINIIPLHPVAYIAWYYAAIMMCEMPNRNTRKQYRIGVHTVLVGLITTNLDGMDIRHDNFESFIGSSIVLKSAVSKKSSDNSVDLPF